MIQRAIANFLFLLTVLVFLLLTLSIWTADGAHTTAKWGLEALTVACCGGVVAGLMWFNAQGRDDE